MAAREPLHVEALDYLVSCTAFERKSAVANCLCSFHANHRLHVFHKSVKDWLVSTRTKLTCVVKLNGVHRQMGKRCKEVWKKHEHMDEVEAEDMYEASVYSLKHCISFVMVAVAKMQRPLCFSQNI